MWQSGEARANPSPAQRGRVDARGARGRVGACAAHRKDPHPAPLRGATLPLRGRDEGAA
jgi:hypothetical protein